MDQMPGLDFNLSSLQTWFQDLTKLTKCYYLLLSINYGSVDGTPIENVHDK